MDAYLHIPVHTQSQKYLRFHHKGITYQFVRLPFDLATALLVFTSLLKEVKLLASQQGIRLHQYPDDRLIKTQSLLSLVKELGFVVNFKNSNSFPHKGLTSYGTLFTRFGSCEAHVRLVDQTDTTQGMMARPTKCATRRFSPPQGTKKNN